MASKDIMILILAVLITPQINGNGEAMTAARQLAGRNTKLYIVGITEDVSLIMKVFSLFICYFICYISCV